MNQKDTYEFDFGFSALSEEEYQALADEQTQKTVQEKLNEVENLILPLLNNLTKDPEKIYIKWPNRKQIVEEQIKKILAITRG